MEKIVKELLEKLMMMEDIHTGDIPNIELYMDQVTTFMDHHLADSKRYDDDKIMTKTMINNYTKNHLLPPSNKKKYSKEHIFLLIMIYYYKNVLSISDIQNLLSPLTDNYFPENMQNGLSMETIYETIIEQFNIRKKTTEAHILDTLQESEALFSDVEMSESDHSALSMYALITQLCYDITLRKQLIEKLIDQLYPVDHQKKNKTDKKQKK